MTAHAEAAAMDDPEPALGNLPVALTPLIGRDAILADLESLLSGTRLLTLCGPGGVGKSRLAAALASRVGERLPAGAWWADLADSIDDDRVAQAVAAAVLPSEQLHDPATAVTRALAGRALLVLDNCEQVASGAARLVAALLAHTPALSVIATSRQPLGVPGEQVWRVPGLQVNGEGRSRVPEREPERAQQPGAVTLFVQRAREAGGSFEIDAPGAREAVSEICGLVDGLPLAVELAAARVSVLGVQQIAERLRRDTSLLRQPGRAATGRHRTLRETLEWSHQLLAPTEQRLFRRLGAFRGPFSLHAAEAVCADELLPAEEVLDLLSILIDQSLVTVVESPSLPRYRLLGTLRQYALHKLNDAGELESTLARHCDHYHAVGRLARTGLAGADRVMWVEGLELDRQNLADALARLLVSSPERAAELASALWPFHYLRGSYDEARTWFARALAHEHRLGPETLVDVLLKAGEVAFLQCDYDVASRHLQRALKLVGEHGEGRRGEAVARQRLGSIAREQGRYAEARGLHEQSMAIWEALEDAEGVASAGYYLGFVAWLSGDFDGAEACSLRSLDVFRSTGNLRDVAVTLISLGAAALYRGDDELAAERLTEALAISRRLGFEEGVAWSLHELAILAHRHRRGGADPETMLRDALLVHQRLGDRWRMASVLEEIAGPVLGRRDPQTAARLLGCAEALRERIGTPVPPAEAADRQRAVERVRRQLTPDALRSAWAQGTALDLDQAVGAAVAAIDRHGATPADPNSSGIAPILTPRELAVLRLLSAGQTNREIAAALYISPSTAGVHVSNILRKLHAKRRVDAAGRAHALGLLPAESAPDL